MPRPTRKHRPVGGPPPKPKEEKPNVIDERIKAKRDVTQTVMGSRHTRKLMKQVDF
jgi:hypothetical protein